VAARRGQPSGSSLTVFSSAVPTGFGWLKVGIGSGVVSHGWEQALLMGFERYFTFEDEFRRSKDLGRFRLIKFPWFAKKDF
jgi:hypothetical protein